MIAVIAYVVRKLCFRTVMHAIASDFYYLLYYYNCLLPICIIDYHSNHHDDDYSYLYFVRQFRLEFLTPKYKYVRIEMSNLLDSASAESAENMISRGRQKINLETGDFCRTAKFWKWNVYSIYDS